MVSQAKGQCRTLGGFWRLSRIGGAGTGWGRAQGRRAGDGYHRGMPRITDLGITIGLLPPGPTGSVLDVPGTGLGHATVWRDEPPPPAGRGIARSGVTVLDPGG